MPAAAAAASLALNGSRGAHPTMRLDGFMRATDASYMHGESQTQGDRFVRKMATYGQVRPSVSFTSESRATRPFKEEVAADVSNLPSLWMDPRGDPREFTFEIPPPPKEINNDYTKLYENHALMTPSERYQEHLAMKAGEKKWREDRKALFEYKKRCRILDRNYQQGIVGIDGPLFPGTKLYAEQRGFYQHEADGRGRHAEGRFDRLATKAQADDATAQRKYGEPHSLARSQDIPCQRKSIDPVKHPYRFLNTHERLFPVDIPTWDPERAAMLRSHDVRDKKHNFLSQADNYIEMKVARSYFDDEMSKSAPHITHSPAVHGGGQ